MRGCGRVPSDLEANGEPATRHHRVWPYLPRRRPGEPAAVCPGADRGAPEHGATDQVGELHQGSQENVRPGGTASAQRRRLGRALRADPGGGEVQGVQDGTSELDAPRLELQPEGGDGPGGSQMLCVGARSAWHRQDYCGRSDPEDVGLLPQRRRGRCALRLGQQHRRRQRGGGLSQRRRQGRARGPARGREARGVGAHC
mmetsp:Transcript_9491/g.33621  ORF Transcript_9491/g.33621 Transcript_9491/m.33621 type:complete len:200 (-) Transcript_9491:540-1139(-)